MIPVRQQLREAVVPVVAWWVLVAFSFLVFAGVVLATEGPTLETAMVLALVGVPTVMGGALGQLLAFIRVRSWILIGFGAFCWFLSFGGAAVLTPMVGEVAAIWALFFFVLPIALTGGLWSLETHRAVWSTWLPMLFVSGAVIVWAEAEGHDAAWFAGNKWAIWDAVTVVVLAIAMGLMLLFLVTRETHRLALWKRGPTAPLSPSLVEKGSARPRLTLFGTVLLCGLTVLLTVTTAAIAPYLWRTGEGDRESQTQSTAPEPQEPPPEGCDQEDPSPAPPPPDPGSAEELGEKMVEAAKHAGAALCMLATIAILVVLGILVFGPPLRRIFVVRHLRDPLWDLPATTRIEHGWRLVEIALGDAGVGVRPGEDARGLARRARPMLERLSRVQVHGLEDAAEVADRVRFGLGVGPDDVAVMQRFSAWVYDTVWERLGDRDQVKAMYRGL